MAGLIDVLRGGFGYHDPYAGHAEYKRQSQQAKPALALPGGLPKPPSGYVAPAGGPAVFDAKLPRLAPPSADPRQNAFSEIEQIRGFYGGGDNSQWAGQLDEALRKEGYEGFNKAKHFFLQSPNGQAFSTWKESMQPEAAAAIGAASGRPIGVEQVEQARKGLEDAHTRHAWGEGARAETVMPDSVVSGNLGGLRELWANDGLPDLRAISDALGQSNSAPYGELGSLQAQALSTKLRGQFGEEDMKMFSSANPDSPLSPIIDNLALMRGPSGNPLYPASSDVEDYRQRAFVAASQRTGGATSSPVLPPAVAPATNGPASSVESSDTAITQAPPVQSVWPPQDVPQLQPGVQSPLAQMVGMQTSDMLPDSVTEMSGAVRDDAPHVIIDTRQYDLNEQIANQAMALAQMIPSMSRNPAVASALASAVGGIMGGVTGSRNMVVPGRPGMGPTRTTTSISPARAMGDNLKLMRDMPAGSDAGLALRGIGVPQQFPPVGVMVAPPSPVQPRKANYLDQLLSASF